MIYNDNDLQDLVSVLAYIDTLTTELGIDPVEIDVGAIRRVVEGCKQDFPHKDGLKKASAFKLVANFVCFFISERPIRSAFSEESVGSLALIDNHQNTLVAFSMARAALKGSKICKANDVIESVTQPIWLSDHSYRDILEALATATPSTHFRLITVLFEQLVYKTNPELQYGWVGSTN